jgi:hypothetical protein
MLSRKSLQESKMNHYQSVVIQEMKSKALRLGAAALITRGHQRRVNDRSGRGGRIRQHSSYRCSINLAVFTPLGANGRAYVWRTGRLSKITHDHSLVAELIETGLLSISKIEPISQTEEKMDKTILSKDEDLRMKISNALADDPDTGEAVIEVINENGIITLVGVVDNVRVRQTAAMIAAQQPGVLSVINSLKVA